MTRQITTINRQDLPQWMQDEFPKLAQVNIGCCWADRNANKPGNGLGVNIAHAHGGRETGVICISPNYAAEVWSLEQPSLTLLHEYAHTITPDRDSRGRNIIHGRAWRANFIRLAQSWEFPAEVIENISCPGNNCYGGPAREFLAGRKPVVQEPAAVAADEKASWKDRASYALRPVASCTNDLHRRIIRARLNGQSYTDIMEWSGKSNSAIFSLLRKYGLAAGLTPDLTGWTG